MSQGFVHLRVHSEFSILDGLSRLPGLSMVCEQGEILACAVTDIANLFGAVKAFQALSKKGIKPIIGAELWVKESPDDALTRCVLLCQNEVGYHNLCELISKGYIEGQRDDCPVYLFEWLREHSDGLIALSGGLHSQIARQLLRGENEKAHQTLQQWRTVFEGAFYLEVSRVGHDGESVYNAAVSEMSHRYKVPLVATNAVVMLHEADFEAHEARVCIQSGLTLDHPDRTKPYTNDQYLKTSEQMRALFSDCPEACDNTLEVAKRCNFAFTLGKPAFPLFPVPKGQTIESFLAEEAQRGLEERLIERYPNEEARQAQRATYEDRLKLELGVITSMGFSGYFLIVSDFIRWAISQKIPVGPGRGSGAGSLVAYSLYITNLDPLAYDLLFERFLNPDRVSLPDFDIDFCMEGRDRVIEYVTQKYGTQNVSQIATFGTMAAKAVVRDVGRVLSHPYGFVDKIAKLIPFEIGMTLDKALADEPLLADRYQTDDDVSGLIDLAKKLEGLTRNVGKHAGGVVIAPSKLTDFSPIYTEHNDSNPVTQFDKDDAEAVGLIKFDFLGLRTLTIIDWAVQAINTARGEGQPPIDINRISIEDPKVFSLLKRCATTAVFQLESRGMKDLIRRLGPDKFEEIVALVALFRPGPLQSGMVDDYIERKHGRAKVEYFHPKLKEVLIPTYGVILYQEQVMQIAQVLAGYSLGEADLLRRAMGKKKVEEMAKQRDLFVNGATDNGVDADQAAHIFDLMEKFAGYGFNKSHSAAYALVSYQTAWLKTHFPDYFMAAVLSADMNHTDKVLVMVKETKQMKLSLLSPDVAKSYYKFTVESPGKIRYGLGAVKGVGEHVVQEILSIREKEGGFESLQHFFTACQGLKLSKRTLEALILSGCFDSFSKNRAQLYHHLEDLIRYAQQTASNAASGQSDLFGQSTGSFPTLSAVAPFSLMDTLAHEKSTLGLYLSGHPYTVYATELSAFVKTSLGQLKPSDKKEIRIAGFIQAMRSMPTKKGDKMAFLTLDDGKSECELALFSDLYRENQSWLSVGELLIAQVTISRDDRQGGIRIRPKAVYNLEMAREAFATAVLVRIQQFDPAHIESLKAIVQAYEGPSSCSLWIEYQHNNQASLLRCGPDWAITPSEVVLNDLKQTFGADNVKVHYKKLQSNQVGEKVD
jgi:DNA polymerase-3 subunit alpha